MSSDSYRLEVESLVVAVTTGPGSLPWTVRRAIVDRASGRPTMTALPDGIPGFTDQVAGDSTSIQDADVRGLLATGLDEEAVFEAIVAAALGSSLVRLERVDVLLDAGS